MIKGMKSPVATESPGDLRLVTGLADDHRKVFRPHDKLHPQFAHAWRWQDTWSSAEHRGFWEAMLPLWPQTSGGQPRVETLAWHVLAMRLAGHEDEAIADALGYQLDDLRRWGALRRAGEVLEEQERGGPPAPPLPRVWSFDAGDPEPSAYGYVNLRWNLREHLATGGSEARHRAVRDANRLGDDAMARLQS